MAKEKTSLGIILNSDTKAKALRYIFRHPSKEFRVGGLSSAIDGNYNTTRSYVEDFTDIDLLKAKPSDSGNTTLYTLNKDFNLYNELKSLVLNSFPVSKDHIKKELDKVGKVRLALLCGLFLNQDNNKVDLFLVADDLDDKKFDKFIDDLEADVGQEVKYALMDTNEFTYRYNIYDRFVRDLLTNEYIKLVDDINVSSI